MVTIREHNPRFLEVMNYIMESRAMTLDLFAKSLEVGRTTLSQVRSGAQNASIDVIAKTCIIYPEINANYILTGRGSMFIQEQESDDSAAMLEEAHRNLEDAMAEIKRLKEENELLRTAFTRLQSS